MTSVYLLLIQMSFSDKTYTSQWCILMRNHFKHCIVDSPSSDIVPFYFCCSAAADVGWELRAES